MKKMNYIYKVSAAVAFAAAMILSASCSKERQFKGDVTGSAEVRFEASVVSGTTSVTTKSGVLTGADGISIPFTMVSEPGINGGAGDAIDTKGTLYNTTGEDMALAAAGIEKFRVVAFNSDYTYFIPAMTDVNYADGKWSTATPYTWAGGEEKLFVAFGNFDGDITFSLDDGSLSGSFAQDIPDEASAQKEILISGYAGNGDSDEDGICDGEVSMIFQHLNTSVVFKMGDMLGVSKIKRIALENVLARREFSFDEEFDITHGDVEPVKTVWQDVNALPEVGEQVGEAFILHEQGLENVILHVYVTISGRDYDLVARLGSDTWMAGNTNVYTLGFGDTVVEPLCITAEDEQSVIFVRMRYNDNTEKTSQLGYPDATIFYSFDKKQWVEWTDFSESVTFGTGEHPSIYLIGSNPDGFGGIYDSENRTYDGSVLYFLHENTEINISGNIMSLIDYSEKLTEFPAGTSGHFAGLFAYAPVRSAADLVLPVNTLSTLCYTGMFAFCSKLQTPPALPAKTMAPYCYHNLFYGCSSLATAPEMPAMNLASYCYWGMYKFCSSLTTAPALPAETLADNCYRDMFDSCTGLQTAPVLPAKTLADGCYMYMFDSCTNLQIAPVLPAATLVENCYRYMFSFCENLNRIEMLATDITAPNCLGSWTSGVPETGTFVKSPALGTRTNASDDNTRICLDSDSGIPEGWTVKNIGLPDGALSGLFTVADDGDGNVKKVYFSKGNLYCSRPSSESSDWTWHFYDNQYDFNSLNSSCDGYGCREAEASDTEIDLFSWGYSAEHSLNPVTTDFVTGHPNDYDELVYDQPSSSGGDDWGVAYCESNGIPTGTWRTLTTAEWQYLLAWDVEEPDTSLPRCGLSKPGVTVCGQVNCVVLLPDDWNEGVISLAQFAETTEYGDATDVTWAEMEAAGAVCLPAAGERNDGSIAGVREWGLYWSSSAMDDKAYCILFFSDTLSSEEYEGRHSSKSVRLVSECK